MIYAREISDRLTGLVKKIDDAVSRYNKQKLGGFVVFCSDDATLRSRLKELAVREKIQHVPFAIEKPAGPEGYRIARDADVTVILYRKKTVKANYAFPKGGLDAESVEAILRDLPKQLQLGD